MQMPVFLVLFFAPVYVPLALLTGWIETVATLNPVTYVLEAVRSMLAGDEVHVALAFGLVIVLVAELLALGPTWSAFGGGCWLGRVPSRSVPRHDITVRRRSGRVRNSRVPHLGSGGAQRGRAPGRRRSPADRDRRRRLGRSRGRWPRRRLPLRARRRRRLAGPVLALAAAGRSWPVPHPRHEQLRDRAGAGARLEELVLYELHVGTFSREGTFDGVDPAPCGLRELGVTAIELMPVATFPGNRGWGYDGLYTFAPHPVYGGPPAGAAGRRRTP